jgi:hypothetical protein
LFGDRVTTFEEEYPNVAATTTLLEGHDPDIAIGSGSQEAAPWQASVDNIGRAEGPTAICDPFQTRTSYAKACPEGCRELGQGSHLSQDVALPFDLLGERLRSAGRQDQPGENEGGTLSSQAHERFSAAWACTDGRRLRALGVRPRVLRICRAFIPPGCPPPIAATGEALVVDQAQTILGPRLAGCGTSTQPRQCAAMASRSLRREECLCDPALGRGIAALGAHEQLLVQLHCQCSSGA